MKQIFRRIKTAVIGCGTISASYLKNITEKFHVLELTACSDIVPERARKRAEEYGLRQMSNEEIYNDRDIEIILNLTYPLSHYEVNSNSLKAGKHVYSEKMMAVDLEDGHRLVQLTNERGLHLTVAPDTFLGGGWQTARNMIDNGWIGTPIAVNATCIRSYQDYGETYTEPKPFIFGEGGGIPFDMGGYYLHCMFHLFGGLKRVSGFLQTLQPAKVYRNPRHPMYGEIFIVDSPNNLSASLEFECGVLGTLLITSESSLFSQPSFEVVGTQGQLSLFDPNDFGGPILLRRNTFQDPIVMQSLYPYNDDSRGAGAADMAYAILSHRPPRLAGLGHHAFETIHGIWESCHSGQVYQMRTTCTRPAALPLIAADGTAYEASLI